MNKEPMKCENCNSFYRFNLKRKCKYRPIHIWPVFSGCDIYILSKNIFKRLYYNLIRIWEEWKIR